MTSLRKMLNLIMSCLFEFHTEICINAKQKKECDYSEKFWAQPLQIKMNENVTYADIGSAHFRKKPVSPIIETFFSEFRSSASSIGECLQDIIRNKTQKCVFLGIGHFFSSYDNEKHNQLVSKLKLIFKNDFRIKL